MSKYDPVLRYVVTRGSGFVSFSGLVVFGKSVWFQESILHTNRSKASRLAELCDGKIEQLKISAFRIGWSHKSKEEIPKEGMVAFSQGWDVAANPHPKGSVESVWWTADWWVANATAYQSNYEGREIT